MSQQLLRLCCALVTLAITLPAPAQILPETQTVIERGAARLSLADLDGRMSRFPDGERADFAHKPENLARLMDQLLLNRQLAQKARATNLDEQPLVRRDIELAIEEILAVHQVNAELAAETEPDFRQLANERYLASTDQYKVPEQRVVEHILIKSENRSKEEALALAEKVHAEVMTPGSDFGALVERYSEDGGKSQNQGRYTIAQPGQFVPEFESQAKSLAQAGDVSEPFASSFGYHIMRLVEVVPPRTKSFDEVSPELIEQARTEYMQRRRGSIISAYKQQPETGSTELLTSLPARYGGRPDLKQPVPSTSN